MIHLVCHSGIQTHDLFGHESPPLTTRPGLPSKARAPTLHSAMFEPFSVTNEKRRYNDVSLDLKSRCQRPMAESSSKR